jgi:hypothetical protein
MVYNKGVKTREAKIMKSNKQVRIYNEYNKADKTILAFTYGNNLYLATLKKIPCKYMIILQGSRNRGKKVNLRLGLKNKLELINKYNATPIMSVEQFEQTQGYNKGDKVEKIIREMYGLEHSHDNLPFYRGCDMVVNNIGYSIKFENAQLFTYKSIDNLLKKVDCQ